MKQALCISGIVSACVASVALATTPTSVVIHVDQPGITISPTLYGMMTEEINHSYDGGLYAELIQNRTFQDNAKNPSHWSLVDPDNSGASIAITRDDAVNPSLPVSLQLKLGDKKAGVANDGYWGIPIKPDTQYNISFYAKASADYTGPITVALESGDGKNSYASLTISPLSQTWTKYQPRLTTGKLDPDKHGRFVIYGQGAGTISLSLVSLMPPTFNDRPNGNRIDLMQKMADMHPSFLRLPGGNYVEGSTFPTRYNWKQMIGPIDKRPGHQGCWGYRSSDGEGLLEMLEWCEDLHIEPLLAVFAGYTLNHDFVPAGDKLQPYVDEAVQEIEYATGDENTTWGKQRVADGHPTPFKIRYVEIGNEDWFDKAKSYDGRFAQFYDAIKSKYPDLQIIATATVKSRKPDLIDDHYYRSAKAMAFDNTHYDKTDRNGPKIFVGEWASTEGSPTPNLKAALGDAAWLMGLERDSDIVVMSCYAPMFVNVNPKASQWGTNLIGYDNTTSFGSPSYYVQALFAQNRGDVVLPTEVKTSDLPPLEKPIPNGRVGVGTWHTQAEFKDLKVTPTSGDVFTPEMSTDSSQWNIGRGKWDVQGGAIAQHGDDEGAIALTGDVKWKDYTFSLKARKTGGDEGFLVGIRYASNRDFIWWNIGGWNNTQTAIETTYDGEKSKLGQPVDMQIETGRWYDLRVEVNGTRIKTYVDDKLVNDVTEQPVTQRTAIFGQASKVNASNEIIVKLVNLTDQSSDTSIDLQGVSGLAGGHVYTMSGAPADQNTVAEPTKLSPQEESFDGTASKFQRTLPPYSVTLMRLKAADAAAH